MSIPSRRLRLRHLVAGWGAYWGGLAVVTLSPAVAAIARLSQTGAKGTATFGFNNGLFNAEIQEAGEVAWKASASIGELALWLAGPPLLIFAGWLWYRRGQPAEEALPSGEVERAALPTGAAADFGTPQREQMFVERPRSGDEGR